MVKKLDQKCGEILKNFGPDGNFLGQNSREIFPSREDYDSFFPMVPLTYNYVGKTIFDTDMLLAQSRKIVQRVIRVAENPEEEEEGETFPFPNIVKVLKFLSQNINIRKYWGPGENALNNELMPRMNFDLPLRPQLFEDGNCLCLGFELIPNNAKIIDHLYEMITTRCEQLFCSDNIEKAYENHNNKPGRPFKITASITLDYENFVTEKEWRHYIDEKIDGRVFTYINIHPFFRSYFPNILEKIKQQYQHLIK